MKKFIIIVVVTMLAIHLPAQPPAASIIPLGNGNWEIIVSGMPITPPIQEYCVVQSSTDLVNWTSFSTNVVTSNTITNIVQSTNSNNFYRAYLYSQLATAVKISK